MSTVLLIEDDVALRKACAQALELDRIAVEALGDAESALKRLSPDFSGVVVTDVRLPGLSGLALLGALRELDPEIPVIPMTGHGDIAMAVEAMRDGAYDFIEKPFPPERLVEAVRRALEKRRLVMENRAYRARLDRADGMEAMLIGVDPATEALRRHLSAVALSDADVLIHGETGTGKEVAARCLHRFGPRAEKPFVAINCGALPETVVESEFFGHARGAFTGAAQRRIGKFEAANGGTVFLDEIESMPPDMQVKLLRVLQERVIEPLGENRLVPIDIRVVAATKRDLRDAARDGSFREDLLYRLDVVSVTLPPLRARREDIPVLFDHFVALSAARRGMAPPVRDPATTARLVSEDWPGNVRELRNRAERFALGFAQGADGGGASLSDGARSLPDRVAAFEKDQILQCLRRFNGSVRACHEALGIGRKTLYEKLQRYGIQPSEFRDD